jgi:cell division protein DivIC
MARKRKKRFVTAFMFIFLLTVFLYSMAIQTLHYMNKRKEQQVLKTELKKLKYEEVVLKKDINKMKSSDYIAKYAREKYFFSKPNEIIIKMD